MVQRKGFSGFLFLVLFIVFFFSRDAFAGIPIPWGAKVIQDDVAVTGSEERKITSYETGGAKKDELLDYYLKEMPARGYDLFMKGEMNLVFVKGEEMVLIVVPPAQNGKTKFMVTTGSLKRDPSELKAMKEGLANCEPIPMVPAYPGARCITSTRMKSAGTRSAAYMINDSIDVALDFYRVQMPQNLWRLRNEMDLNEVMTQGLNGQGSPVPAEAREGMRQLYGNARGLVFVNDRNNQCVITAMGNPAGSGILLSINYEEKSQAQ